MDLYYHLRNEQFAYDILDVYNGKIEFYILEEIHCYDRRPHTTHYDVYVYRKRIPLHLPVSFYT